MNPFLISALVFFILNADSLACGLARQHSCMMEEKAATVFMEGEREGREGGEGGEGGREGGGL